MRSYGEIQSEVILNGGTIQEAEELYQKELRSYKKEC